MSVHTFFAWLNNEIFALPAMLLFFGTGVVLTFKMRFIQLRAFPRFISLITKGVKRTEGASDDEKTINPFHALFTAMATTIGMGNMVGPSVAIMIGGPGALFWLVVYMFFASVTKFAEVTFALHTRERTPDGHVIGGPMQYLKAVHPFLAYWYTVVIIILLASWSSLQSNTLANIFALEHVPRWLVGLALAVFVLLVLRGGVQRVGAIASKIVPVMFILYISFALLILLKDLNMLYSAIRLVMHSVTKPAAAMGGFAGATMFQALRMGIYKGIFISEAGLGTSSIPHAVADTEHPVDQGVLAMCSMVADATLSVISGLLILVTGVWTRGSLRPTLIYEAVKLNSPTFGGFVLLIAITLFILTTVMGNSFNGTQSFGSLTNYRWVNAYIAFTVLVIFLGALMPMPLIWEVTDTLITLVAVPNLIGILILTFKKGEVLKN